MKLNEQNLEALRIGIREQEREALTREDIQRSMDRTQAREYVDNPVLRRAADLRVNDKMIGTADGRWFWVAGTITSVGDHPGRLGKLWITYTVSEGGTGGSQFERDDLVLMVRG